VAERLSNSATLWRLARDLGIKPSPDPLSAILGYCHRRVGAFLTELSADSTLEQLLEMTANKVGTSFEVIREEDDLERVRATYTAHGERMFARLAEELTAEVYGITFQLQRAQPWELPFVSVIDARGPKAARVYFTKWHEVAHLLTLTSQGRLQFFRTHAEPARKDPEEVLADIVAGLAGFYAPVTQRLAIGEPSFSRIKLVRDRLCPTASVQAALIGITAAWREPLLLVRAQPALRKRDREHVAHPSFDFMPRPEPSLRAVKITASIGARSSGFTIHPNMRVPERSVIQRLFRFSFGHERADEDMSWWEASDGTRLPHCSVRVEARWGDGGVDALIFPMEPHLKAPS